MPRKVDVPFTVGQDVEATFAESGYRGAWFRCRVLDIAAAEPRLLLKFVDFPDEGDTWARVRVTDPAVKTVESWLKKRKPIMWAVRPVTPVVHERDVNKYREDVRVGRKCPGHVYVYNDKYTDGDMVEWWKDDCFWGAQIVGINIKTNKAKLKLPLPPVGEGDGKMVIASVKDLRPSFTWSPKFQWKEQGSKKRKSGTGCTSDKPHICRVDLPGGDSTTPGVMSGESISSDSTSSVKSQPEERAVNSTEEEKRNNNDSHELVAIAENVYDRVKMRRESTAVRVKSRRRRRSTVDRAKQRRKIVAYDAIKQESPQEVKEGKVKRKVHFSVSGAISNSVGEEETSAKEEPEDIDGVPTAVGDSKNVSVATAEEDLPKVELIVHESEVSATGDAVVSELAGEKINLPVESLGSCLTTENADGLGDQTGEVDGDGTSNQTHLAVPRDILENSRIADGPSDVAGAQVCSPAQSEGEEAPQEEDSSTVGYNKKRRWEESEDEVEISQKRLCQTNTDEGVDLPVGPTLASDGKEVCVFGSVLKRAHEKENRIENLRQPDVAAQVLNLGLGIFASRFNAGFKRKQVCNMDPGKESKRMRADVEAAVGNSPIPAPVVELPRMRGAIKAPHEVPGKLRESRFLDPVINGKKKPVESVGFQQEQLVEDPLCGHIEQKSLGKSSSSGFPTNSHLSSGSNHETLSRDGLDSEVLDHKSEEDKITLQPNWVIRDGKLVCIVEEKVDCLGSSSTREEFLTANQFSIPKEKGPPRSSSCHREQADGNYELSILKEKPLNYNTLLESIKGNAFKSSSTVVEPTVGIANETTVGVSKTSGANEQNAGASETVSKVVEQDLSMTSIKEKALAGLGAETLSLVTTGVVQRGTDTVRGRPLDSSRTEKVVNTSNDIPSIVKPEVSEPQPEAAAASTNWVHDTVKCRRGKEALNRVSLENFKTPEEIQVAEKVRLYLWQGLCCSRESFGLGRDLPQRIQLLSRMYFETLVDGDSRKVLINTGKPGEQLYLGHYKTETEFGAARRIVSRCKKELQKAFVTSGVVETQQVPNSVLAEQLARLTSASQATGPGMPSSTIGREFSHGMQNSTLGWQFGQSSTIGRDFGHGLHSATMGREFGHGMQSSAFGREFGHGMQSSAMGREFGHGMQSSAIGREFVHGMQSSAIGRAFGQSYTISRQFGQSSTSGRGFGQR